MKYAIGKGAYKSKPLAESYRRGDHCWRGWLPDFLSAHLSVGQSTSFGVHWDFTPCCSTTRDVSPIAEPLEGLGGLANGRRVICLPRDDFPRLSPLAFSATRACA